MRLEVGAMPLGSKRACSVSRSPSASRRSSRRSPVRAPGSVASPATAAESTAPHAGEKGSLLVGERHDVDADGADGWDAGARATSRAKITPSAPSSQPPLARCRCATREERWPWLPARGHTRCRRRRSPFQVRIACDHQPFAASISASESWAVHPRPCLAECRELAKVRERPILVIAIIRLPRLRWLGSGLAVTSVKAQLRLALSNASLHTDVDIPCPVPGGSDATAS